MELELRNKPAKKWTVTNAKGKRNNELEGRMDYLKVYIKQVLTHSDLLAILTALAEKINRLWTD